MNLQQGTLLQGGKYQIKKVLGQGGFGITYLAQQVSLDRYVAVKEFFMKDFCDRDDSTSRMTVGSSGSRYIVSKYREKFVKEAKSIAKLNHPNIVRVIDVFEENETAYYVMEYLSDDSLSMLVKKRGRLSQDEAVKYIGQIASALEYIHDRNMLHLDVKPANVLLDEKMDAVLIDFGMVKHYDTEGNQTSTTPVGISVGYAPLEQYSMDGKTVLTPTSDIYALGATFYKLLTGITPPDASSLIADPELMEFPSYLSAGCVTVIRAAMNPVAKKRPQTISNFKTLLEDSIVSEREETTVIYGNDDDTVVIPEKKQSKDAVTVKDGFINNNKYWSKYVPSSGRSLLYALVFYGMVCLLWTINLVRCADMKEYTLTALIFGFSAGTCLLSVMCLMRNLRLGFVGLVLMFVRFLIFLFCYVENNYPSDDFQQFVQVCISLALALIPLALTFAGIRFKNKDGVTKWRYMKSHKSNFVTECLKFVTVSCLIISYMTTFSFWDPLLFEGYVYFFL